MLEVAEDGGRARRVIGVGARAVLPILLLVLLGAHWPAPAAGQARNTTDVQVVQTTASLSDHLTTQANVQFSSSSLHGMPVIKFDDSRRYQRISGFGAAMTDTSAWLIYDELPAAARDALMGELFGSGGIHLNFLRVPMAASDFTRNGIPYSYDDLPAGRSDPRLLHFSIAHDNAYVLPALQQVKANDPGVQMIATPWSPPAWMKTNGSLDNYQHTGKLRGSDYGPLASYFVRFLKAYARAGVPISEVTPQNEPGQATLYPGLEWSEPTQVNWINRRLVPALRAAHLHPKVYGNDLGWGPRGTAYGKGLATSRAAKNLTGIAWHCYFGTPYIMSTVKKMDPRLDVILDECSPGITQYPITEVGIGALRNSASVAALWNLALDLRGGPVEPPNHGCPSCTGLVTINEHTGTFKPNINYYELGQLSEFIQPGAHRIDTPHFVHYTYKSGVNPVSPGIDDVGVVNPDGTHVLVAYNSSSQTQRFGVSWKGQTFTYSLAGGATATFVWDQP